MKEERARLTAFRTAGEGLFVLELQCRMALECAPGQFVNVRSPGGGEDPFLRRPFSVAWVDHDQGTLELLVQIRGRGTERLAELRPGDAVSLQPP